MAMFIPPAPLFPTRSYAAWECIEREVWVMYEKLPHFVTIL